MDPERTFDVAIVGAGFSGTMTAVQLALHVGNRPLRIALIDPSVRFGRGVAYGTTTSQHLLNVPAKDMSAFPDRPDHFVAWARQSGIAVTPGSFLSRESYGAYLQNILNELPGSVRLTRVIGRVGDVIPTDRGARLLLTDSTEIQAERVVLSGCNFPPSSRPLDNTLPESRRSIRDPWRAGALTAIQPDEPVLLVGTGLTMIDVVLALEAHGHRATIHALSRRGLLPQPHRVLAATAPLEFPPELDTAPATASGLFRALRRAVRRAEQAGRDWREVIGALRSRTPQLWAALNLHERARFLQHLRPFWDTHRHRIPPEVARQVEQWRAAGRLVVHAGRIRSVDASADELRVRIRPRREDREQELQAGWVVNCTGPGSDVEEAIDPLWRHLLQRGLIQPDALKLGLLTSPEGALLNRAGEPQPWIYLIGPLRKAQLWECTAVPELRGHAEQLARHLIECLQWRKSSLPAAGQPALMNPSGPADFAEFAPTYVGAFI